MARHAATRVLLYDGLCPVGAALCLLLGTACTSEPTSEVARLSLTTTLGGADTSGYARALEPRPFHFPADHGPHPGFRTEWWYVTGNLDAGEGRRFGFQLTFFRNALGPEAPTSPSAWATNQAYMAHFAFTDITSGDFHAYERFDRGALDLAGARAEPFRVWVGDWSLASDGEAGAADTGGPGSRDGDPRGGSTDPVGGATGPDDPASSGDSPFPVRLRAASADVVLDLLLDRGKPVVLQGEHGLSRKGPEPGNASYYYSLTRMPAGGTIRVGADTLTVTGLAWLDREWSTSALSAGVEGWDWFALQLDDGWDLMAYRLRAADGSAAPFSEGVLVDPEGASRRLVWGRDVQVTQTASWTAPGGTVYPAGWRVRVPSRGWDLDVVPAVADQELALAFRYWEGAVRVDAHVGSVSPRGRGYVELTGYAGDGPVR